MYSGLCQDLMSTNLTLQPVVGFKGGEADSSMVTEGDTLSTVPPERWGRPATDGEEKES